MESSQLSGSLKSSREILKQVDQLVKANNLEKALQEVRRARELDPKNLYTFAYEERIQELIAKRQLKETTTLKDVKETTKPNEVLKPYNVNEQILSERSDMYGKKVSVLYEEFKKAGLLTSNRTDSTQTRRSPKEVLDTYKQALLLVWSDGQKNEEEIHELHDLKQALRISDEEHDMLDKQVRLESYIFLLKHLLRSPSSKAEVETSLAELRKSFSISNSDHVVIEANLTALKATKGKKQTIIVIDDEKQMLTLIKEILQKSHYDVIDFITSDYAFEFLKNEKVDLILCDISLESSTMNGFLFYERIRELGHLQHVPFIFITGLNDAVLMRAGKEMGVDDFLVKPIHCENLLATVRGRIKRYEQMRLLSGL